jgi:DNA polymerase I-like protein with 3'-5' exonuclease and polymerase domains
MNSQATTQIIFKAPHDIAWMHHTYGYFPAGPLYDPMIAYHLLDENYPDKSLEGICLRVFNNVKPWKKEFWAGFDWGDIDWEALVEYCGIDTVMATRLAFWTAQKLVEEGLEKLFVHEMANRMTTIEGICLGVPFDQGEAESLRDGYLLEAEAMGVRAAEMVGREINLNAPGQVLEVLKTLNRRVRDTSTPTLRRWLWRTPDTPFVRLMLEHRRLQSKLRYLKHYQNTLRVDRRFHADMEPITETGRYRCSGPNLMNVMR